MPDGISHQLQLSIAHIVMSAARVSAPPSQLAFPTAGQQRIQSCAALLVSNGCCTSLSLAIGKGSPASSGWTAPQAGAPASANPGLCAILGIFCAHSRRLLRESRCRSVGRSGQRRAATRRACLACDGPMGHSAIKDGARHCATRPSAATAATAAAHCSPHPCPCPLLHSSHAAQEQVLRR